MDRRAFVKGSIVAAGAAAVAGGAFSLAHAAALPRASAARRIRYVGATRARGPAPRGLPMLPLALDAQGRVVADLTFGGAMRAGDVLEWYRYCGHQDETALSPDYRGDELLRYHTLPERIELYRPWYASRLGESVRGSDFPGARASAAASWRAGDGAQSVPVILLRVDAGDALSLAHVDDALRGPLARQIKEVGLLAYVAYCTHFCCLPGAHEDPRAAANGFPDAIFCGCHGSTYDPFEPRSQEFESDAAPLAPVH